MFVILQTRSVPLEGEKKKKKVEVGHLHHVVQCRDPRTRNTHNTIKPKEAARLILLLEVLSVYFFTNHPLPPSARVKTTCPHEICVELAGPVRIQRYCSPLIQTENLRKHLILPDRIITRFAWPVFKSSPRLKPSLLTTWVNAQKCQVRITHQWATHL